VSGNPLAWASRYGIVDRFKTDIIALAVVFLAVFALDAGLLGRRIPKGEDHLLAFIPAYRIGEHGWPPSWNPYVCGGMPFAADLQYSPWYPPRWIFCFSSAVGAYGFYCFVHFLIAAAAMFICLRAFRAGPQGAALGALSFACGSYIQGHLSNPGLLFSSVWLPLVAAGSVRAFERKGLGGAILLGLLLAVVVFAGSPHNIFYSLVITGLAALWVVATGGRTGVEGPRSARSLVAARVAGRLAVAGFFAAAVGAVQMLPTAEFLRFANRFEIAPSQLARDPLAWDWLDNLFLGSPLVAEYLDKSTYFGLSALPLLLAAFTAPSRRPRHEWFFAALGAVGIWIALGRQAGAFQLFAHLPVARALSGPSRGLVLFAVGTSALVGLGADKFLRREDGAGGRSLPIVVGLCAGAAVALFLLFVLLARKVGFSRADLSAIVRSATTAGDPRLFLWLNGAFFVALGSLLLGAAHRGLVPRSRFIWVAGLLLFFDLLHFHARLLLPTADRDDLAPPATVSALRADGDRPFRVAGYEPTRLNPGDINDLNLRPLLMPNTAAFYGLQDIQGFDPLLLADYVRLVEATAGRSPIDDRVRMLNIARPDATLFRLLNVRYLVGDVRERLVALRPQRRGGAYAIALDRPTTLAGVSLVSLLDRAHEVGAGTTVALVVVRAEDAAASAPLLAGVHTADWRAADPRFPCRHRPALENMRWEVLSTAGSVKVANYYGRVEFRQPIRAREIEIRPLIPGIVLWIGTVAAVLPDVPGWEKVFEQGRYRIYRNLDALGGAWIVHRLRHAAGPKEALDLIARGEVDPAREAVVTGAITLPAGSARGDGAADAGEDRVEFLRYKPDRIEIRTRSNRAGLLCLAEVYYPGWKAEIDGKAAPIVRVNFCLRGIVLPSPGKHIVALRYSPLSLAAGKAVSAAGLLLAACLLLLDLRRRKERPRPGGQSA